MEAPSAIAVELPRDISAPVIARRTLGRFDGELTGNDLSVAQLLVTELVSNAVRHGRGPVELELVLRDGRLRCTVRDGGRFDLSFDRRDGDMGGGLGLRIVASEAERWGLESEPATVWFELRLTS